MRIAFILANLLLIFATAGATVIYVDTDAVGASDGSCWSHAYVDLQDALGVALAGDEVWVAEGTYSPTNTTDWTATFSLVNGVGLYGGFSGGETTRSERDWDVHPTVLTGDNGLGSGTNEVAANVVTAVTTDSTTCLDGFTIRDGRRGLLIDGGNPRIRNALITNNRNGGEGAGARVRNGSRPSFYEVEFFANVTGHGYGGGIRTQDLGTWVTLEHVLFEGNIGSGTSGGGMSGIGDFNFVEFRNNWCDDYGGGLSGSGVLNNVSFVRNNSNQGGGGMAGGGVLNNVQFIDNRVPGGRGGGGLRGGWHLTNVLFSGNEASFGGGMYSGGATLINVVFDSNRALSGQGLLVGEIPWLWHPNPIPTVAPTTLINVTFSGHTSVAQDGQDWDRVPLLASGGTVSLTNCIIWSEDDVLGEIPPIMMREGEFRISDSIIQRSGGSGVAWDPAFGTDLGGNLDLDPLFADGANGDLRLTGASPAIDAGNNAALPAGILYDLDNEPRIVGAAVDMGAYEFSGSVKIDDLPGNQPAAQPQRYLRAAPNPFNPSTTIYFGLERSGHVSLTIYTLSGRELKTLISGSMLAGDHKVAWNGRDKSGARVASGVYLCRLQTSGFVKAQRLVLVK